MAVRTYRELIVWQEAMALATRVYGVTKTWPREEAFVLTPQIRRSAVSIPSNIVEGQGRNSSAEFRQHLSIANGSLMELETQIQIAAALGYQSPEETAELLDCCANVGRLLNGLSKSLPRQRPPSPSDSH